MTFLINVPSIPSFKSDKEVVKIHGRQKAIWNPQTKKPTRIQKHLVSNSYKKYNGNKKLVKTLFTTREQEATRESS